MFKLIVVEDEPLMQDYIVNSVDWEKNNINLLRVFHNGNDAYDYICENKVDIVVTDIKMPGMDGLSLIEGASFRDSNIKFIVLSSYNDFHMVKSAFKYGASDYILKNEFEPEDFEILLQNITSKSSNRQPSKEDDILKKHKLKQFFWNGTSMRSDDNLRIDSSGSLQTVVLRLTNYKSVLELSWKGEHELINYGLSNCIEEILGDFGIGEFFFNTYDEIIILFANREDLESKLNDLFERLCEVFTANFSLIVSAGIYDDIMNIP